MNEEEIVNRFLNMIATEYNGDLATQFKNQYILKDKEIERLNCKIEDIKSFCKSFDPKKLTYKEKVMLDSVMLIINGTIKVVR